MTGSKPILCLDFDGVIHSYASGWQGADFIPDPPVEGAMKFLHDALEFWDVKIYSSRSHQENGIYMMRKWLQYWAKKQLSEFEYNRVFQHYCTVTAYAGEKTGDKDAFPMEKPSAQVSIDDRAITFTGTWPDPQELRNFKPWNK
jgi:hypothetical protein